MIMQTGLCLCVLLIQKIQADEVCYYRNQTTISTVSCQDDCCAVMATSPSTACCSGVSWGTLALPIFVIGGVCLLAICLIYFRPLFKCRLCGWKCPCASRSRVTTPGPMAANDNPVYIMNDDLPDYETITKDSRMKDTIPPPYNFVAAHPTDFGIEARGSNSPPKYYSRPNSASTVAPTTPVES